ncbi:GNAT family N-acetyltransferase [Peptostreptococcaceae bacterium AGR-M142]
MKTFESKIGEIVIDKADLNDALELINYMKKVGSESDFLTFGEGEFDQTIDDIKYSIKESITKDNILYIVAKHNKKIIGNLKLSASQRPRILHVGEFGISVLKDYWGNKVGKELLLYMIDWAKSGNMIKKINLYVRTDNHGGIKLYEKLGFKIEGTTTRSYFIDNKYYDSHLMGLEL